MAIPIRVSDEPLLDISYCRVSRPVGILVALPWHFQGGSVSFWYRELSRSAGVGWGSVSSPWVLSRNCRDVLTVDTGSNSAHSRGTRKSHCFSSPIRLGRWHSITSWVVTWPHRCTGRSTVSPSLGVSLIPEYHTGTFWTPY